MSWWFKEENEIKVNKEYNNLDKCEKIEPEKQFNRFDVYRNGNFAGNFTCIIDREFKLACYSGDTRVIYTSSIATLFKRGNTYEIHTVTGSSYIIVLTGELAKVFDPQTSWDAYRFTVIDRGRLKGHGRACITADFKLYYLIDDSFDFCYSSPIISLIRNDVDREIKIRTESLHSYSLMF